MEKEKYMALWMQAIMGYSIHSSFHSFLENKLTILMRLTFSLLLLNLLFLPIYFDDCPSLSAPSVMSSRFKTRAS